MCKYCEESNAIWLRKKNIYYGSNEEYFGKGKILSAIFDFENKSFFKGKYYLSVDIASNNNDKKQQGDWFDIRINYCPMCGRNLKRKTLSNTIRAIINYYYDKKHENDLQNGIAKCSKCGKNIKEKDKIISYEGKNIYCEKCSKEK